MLYHATHVRNLESIREKGLLKSYSTGRSQLVWLHSKIMWSYAVHHVSERHGWEPADVVIIEVDVRYVHTRASRWHGIFNLAEDVPAEALGRAFQLTTLEIRGAAPGKPHTSAA